MPPLLSVLEEAHCWLLDGGTSPDLVLPVPPHWEWVTAVVWTCSKSCQGPDLAAWIEQPVTVLHEQF